MSDNLRLKLKKNICILFIKLEHAGIIRDVFLFKDIIINIVDFCYWNYCNDYKRSYLLPELRINTYILGQQCNEYRPERCLIDLLRKSFLKDSTKVIYNKKFNRWSLFDIGKWPEHIIRHDYDGAMWCLKKRIPEIARDAFLYVSDNPNIPYTLSCTGACFNNVENIVFRLHMTTCAQIIELVKYFALNERYITYEPDINIINSIFQFDILRKLLTRGEDILDYE